MAEKKYSLSLEQLNKLVSDAVATAIKKLENVEIIDDDSAEKPSENKADVEVSQMADDQYIIAVGTWIDQSPEAVDQIIDEFDLPREKTIVKKASHWDIGQTWND